MRTLVVPVVALALLLSACGKAPSTTTSSSPPLVGISAMPPTSAAPTPSPATSSTPAASLAVGTVVTLPDTGVTFSTADQINAATWLSSDQRTYLTSELAAFKAANGSCATVVLSGYRVGDLMNGQNFGAGSTPCDGGGGYAILWGKVAGTWTHVIEGQDNPLCADIRTAGWKTTIPKEFFGGQCYEKGSDTLVDYKP